MIKILWFFSDFLKNCQISWLFPDWKSAFQFSPISRSGRNPDLDTLLPGVSSQEKQNRYCNIIYRTSLTHINIYLTSTFIISNCNNTAQNIWYQVTVTGIIKWYTFECSGEEYVQTKFFANVHEFQSQRSYEWNLHGTHYIKCIPRL